MQGEGKGVTLMFGPADDFKDRLLDLLLAIPAFDEPGNRDFLLRNLPALPVAAIGRNPAKITDLFKIITAAEAMGQLVATGEWALTVVARNALPFVKGTQREKGLDELLAEVQTRASPLAPEPIPELVIGQDARLPADFLAGGVAALKSVAKLLIPRVVHGIHAEGNGSVANGTGWKITPDLLLTNYHVIQARDPSEPPATESDIRSQVAALSAWFGFDHEDRDHWEYACVELVHFDRQLDYALLRLSAAPRYGTELSIADWRFLAVPPSPPSLKKGFRLNIVQHAGGPKQIAIRSNFYVDSASSAAQPSRIRYLTDTAPGASGAPVFDDNWQVVALHHASVRVPDTQYKGEVVKYNNQGISIHAILRTFPSTNYQEVKLAQGWT